MLIKVLKNINYQLRNEETKDSGWEINEQVDQHHSLRHIPTF